MKPLSGRRKAYDRILRHPAVLLRRLLTCALLVFIIGYIFVAGPAPCQLGPS